MLSGIDFISTNMANTRHSRSKRVDYKALNSFSSADIHDKLTTRKRHICGSRIYQVERIISRRSTKNKDFEYLIKWENWPLWTCTWEPSIHLDDHLIRYEYVQTNG
ncbi:hypothetical protein AC249_AIPGENE23391 [Exaiptasia diaphana]|nr:hypothetical protein AC249_AIPGENE23391 [Exaiptasia diaphana]